MEILIKVIQLLLSLSILIIVHECGHFFFAKLFKTRVEKFYLFFDPWFSLFKYKKGDTEYGIGWLPLGGYVKISGMIDESMDREAMKLPAQPYEFRSKPTWQRLLIMLGGVMVNFIMALVIYAGVLYCWGHEYLPTANAKYGIMTDSLGLQIGLKNGDKIISVDHEKVEDFHYVTSTILLNKAKTIQILRDSTPMDIQIPESFFAKFIKNPRFFDARIPFVVGGFAKQSVAKEAGMLVEDSIVAINDVPVRFYDEIRSKLQTCKGQLIKVSVIRKSEQKEISVKVPETGLLGIALIGDPKRFFETKFIHYSLLESIPAGIKRGFTASSDYLKQFKLIFSRETKGYESLGGFITIGSIFPGVWDWQSFWSLTAFLSIILAIMNVLPIPALDGGHVLFLLYEIITGRKPSDKFLEYAQITGMVLILGLLLFANGNDVFKLVRSIIHH
jgi:regulator of sigma E protease